MRRSLPAFLISLVATAVLAAGSTQPAGHPFRDRLDTPSATNRLAVHSQLSAVATAGPRLVAVGARGLIVLSDDRGETWRQVPAPVSSDLVTVRFVSAQQGWAGGHDGVILATTDGGATWAKQLDGRQADKMLTAYFTDKAAKGDADATRMLEEVRRNYENGPELPILDLWFESAERGWAVGGFGTLFGTRDGGKTWESWFEKIDSDKMFNYNAVRGVGGEIYIASEQGTVFRLDRARDRFVPHETGYKGSFFGVVGSNDYLVAYGLRGSAYRSRDKGATWSRLETGILGGLTGAALLEDGRLLMASQDGRLLVSTDSGDSFSPLQVKRPMLFTDIAQAGPGRVALTGIAGVQIATLP